MTVTNKDRAEWARKALQTFSCGSDCEYADSLGDLLCDLMHFADVNNFDFKAALDRARTHYAEEFFEKEPAPVALTPYMAVFSIPAGTARQIFCANSPEEALQKARNFSDDSNLTEAEFDPTAEGYCVRQIEISDEHDQQHALWQTDEYRLQLAAPKLLQALEKQIAITREIIDAWNNTDQLYCAIEDLISQLNDKAEWAREVIKAGENSDLSGPIDSLEQSLESSLDAVAQAKGGAA
jgi:hypothetical protein